MSYWNADSDRDWLNDDDEEAHRFEMDSRPPWPGKFFDALGLFAYEAGNNEPLYRFKTHQLALDYVQMREDGVGHSEAIAQLALRDKERRCATCRTWYTIQLHNHDNHCDRCIAQVYRPSGLWCDKHGPMMQSCPNCAEEARRTK